jgi:four helix bundle protein
MKPSQIEHGSFPHERLDAWHVARRARVLAMDFTRSLPAGQGEEVRQINKAAASVVRNICEGANRWKPAEKRHKFEIAQGEAGEAVGAVVSLCDCGLGDQALADAFVAQMGRVGMMLTGLIKRQLRG